MLRAVKMFIFKDRSGEQGLHAAVSEFYQRMFSDPLLAPMFEGVSRKSLIKKQRAFRGTVKKGEAGGCRGIIRKSHAHRVYD